MDIGDGLDPNDPDWNDTPASQFNLKHLDAQDTACGYADGYEERLLQVKGVHDGTYIYFRYEWDDPSESILVNDTNKYADGVALQIPLGAEGNRNTTIQMGSQNNPVNILFWRADLEQPQNIVAGGIGTVHPSGAPPLDPEDPQNPDDPPPSQNIVHSQNWENGRWTVIMGRPMDAVTATSQVQFTSGRSYGAVFANWEGGDFERNGHKAISQWINMDVE
jgi:DMSO reductase family type II enzyme heme b subunit